MEQDEKGISGINERFLLARKALGLDQKKMAASLGISQGYISDIESGNKMPSDTILIAFAYRWEINIHWLLTGEGDMRDTHGMAYDREHSSDSPELHQFIEKLRHAWPLLTEEEKTLFFGMITRMHFRIQREGKDANFRKGAQRGKDHLEE
jgi:transcriptional regulator with XRE-family HTH domain